jgi:hypothetical protein
MVGQPMEDGNTTRMIFWRNIRVRRGCIELLGGAAYRLRLSLEGGSLTLILRSDDQIVMANGEKTYPVPIGESSHLLLHCPLLYRDVVLIGLN